MSSKHAWKVDLIPWDHRSTEQIARLYEQRVACGWMAEEIPSFVKLANKGGKVFYWVVLADEVPEQEILLKRHFVKYPKEASPLTDTAGQVRLVSRVPSEQQFVPIGHIALDIHAPEEDEKLGLPRSGVVWVHQLYISYALQSEGFGVAAMSKAEQLATSEPLNASIMAVDTMVKEMHMDAAIQKISYDDRGLPRPTKSNEEWYMRLGYQIFARTKEGYKKRHSSGTIALEIAFLKKSLH
ncbi:hypothetical protein EV356DRAFT_501419 [Viridothelium virens]|uniref:N-acetyltransferase domain-containing protein n=1 Tax=Viridothelium virens TaxID=1048519 RepID=A0A6A6H8Y8_VIRVR|nr:hypothetical protein EV356DRAFT_501419 [Viridothelium virens]